jgi:hypothetical protein
LIAPERNLALDLAHIWRDLGLDLSLVEPRQQVDALPVDAVVIGSL